MFNLQEIKLAALTMFVAMRRQGESNRSSGTARMTLGEGTPRETQIEFDIWSWDLQEKDIEKWMAKDKKRTKDYAPTTYVGAEAKQKAAFFIDPVEALQGQHIIDSGKGPQDRTLDVERQTQLAADIIAAYKADLAMRDDEIDESEKENAA